MKSEQKDDIERSVIMVPDPMLTSHQEPESLRTIDNGEPTTDN
jgi:hypothetical protein